ncbi:MAG: hypothetical protein II333_06385, partial [Clostridia bacterium]|nr:hypothetical protein [Clostridia bacterium]
MLPGNAERTCADTGGRKRFFRQGGHFLEKEEAKEEFEEAKSEGKSAALLEQQRPNVFTMDIANVMPGDIVSIELHYTELISPVEGIYQFVFPTVAGPRYASASTSQSNSSQTDSNQTADTITDDSWLESPYLPEGSAPMGKYNINVTLSTGVPITSLSSKT